MSTWTISDDFRFDKGEPDGAHGKSGYTWDEFCAKTPPPCPKCGEPIDVSPVAVPDGGGRDLFIPGPISCPSGCQRQR